MRIAITGSTGLIGTALRRSLEGDGHDVVPVVRAGSGGGRPAGGDAIEWDLERRTVDAAAFAGIDAVVHLAGHPIGAKRWNPEEKRQLVESRTVSTALLAETLASLPAADRPSVLVSGSGVNYYGDRGDEVLTEGSGPGPAGSFLTELCVAWEAATGPAVSAGIRTCTIRTSVVLDPKHGGLAKMLPLFKLGLGGPFGRGRPWMPWIALADEVGAIRFLIDAAGAAGPFNLAAPGSVRNAEFAKTLGRVLRRPAFVPVPPIGPKLLLGSELATELLFTSMRVEPAALLAAGYVFRFPTLEPALRATLER